MSPSSPTQLPLSVLRRRVAPTTMLFVRQLMSYSPCKKENGRKRRVKGKERSVGRRTAGANADRDFLSVRVSYRLPASSLTRISYVPFHLSFLSFSLSCTPVALSRPQYLFSSVTSVPVSRFTSAISHLDTRRNVSGRWERRRERR